ncbi:MAG TPA: hypothetical protein VMH48_09580 [Methylomirabilota bacterium]|nr:hypothetical protein [Methylomirabilota bacterium]
MCPACVASAALFTTSVVSTGGVAALAAQLFRKKKTPAKVSEVRDEKENSK